MKSTNQFERKYGKYAIPNLTTVIVILYLIGYILYYTGTPILDYLTLNPYKILQGQVWRLFTWVLMPPAYGGIFTTVIMIYFYWTIGKTLERVWGDYRYNVYMFMGFLFTVVGSFVAYFGVKLLFFEEWGLANPENMEIIFKAGSTFFNTYYVTLSIFLAFAATFPDAVVMLMFIIPIKVKWLGYFYGVVMFLEVLQSRKVPFATTAGQLQYIDFAIFVRCSIIFSVMNFIVFWLTSRKRIGLNPKQIRRRQEFKRQVERPTRNITRHKCAICGRTEESNPELEFRFCSKCNGNYEYCQDHLFTHQHIL
ncbi:MAG: hypothetical protein ACI4EX_10125 [Lachnospiraceae bacterium]